MKKYIIIPLALSTLLITGCLDEVKDDAVKAYENLKEEVTELSDKFNETKDKVNETAEDLEQAKESIDAVFE